MYNDKILLISVNREKFPDPVFPLGAAYISGALSNADLNHNVLDLCFADNPFEKLEDTDLATYDIILLSVRNIDDVAFPVSTAYSDYYLKIISYIRKTTKSILIMGGSGPSVLPEDCYKTFLPDYLIQGEGEKTIVNLIQKIMRGIPPVKGIIKCDMVDLENNIIADRSKFDMQRYLNDGGCINIQTRRGCPFKCNYCTYPISEGKDIRYRSIDSIISELTSLKKQGVDHYFFVDNVFNYPEDYAMDIAQSIIDSKLNIRFSAYLKPYSKNSQFYELMRKAGMKFLDFGTDACSDIMLKNWRKHFTVEDIRYAHQLAADSGIKISHSLILGGPGETMDTMKETVNNIIELSPQLVICMLGVRVYKGTELYQNMIKMGEMNESDGGIKPFFFLSEHIEDEIIDFANGIAEKYSYWIIPGLKKNYQQNYIRRQRKKGKRGQIWEWFD